MNNIIKKATWFSITPRTWQLEAFEEVFKHYNCKKPVSALVEAVTASGKSNFIFKIATSAVLKNDEMVCITTPTILALEELKAIFMRRRIDVGVVYNREYKIRPITIVCDGSVHKLIDFNIKLLIPDEAHGTECETYIDFVKKAKPKLILGVTGTPYKSEVSGILSLYKKVIYKYQSSRALIDKVIVPWRLFEPDWKWGKKRSTQDEVCVRVVKEFEGKGIVNSSSIKDAEKFNRLLQRRGIKSQVLHCEQKRNLRKEILHDFIHGETRVLVYADMLRQSIDMPFLRWGVFRRKVSSRLRFVQELGRLLRTDKGKEYCNIYDPHDLFGKFNVTNDAAVNAGDFTEFDGRGNGGAGGFNHLIHPYETKLQAENAIRNISSMLRAYGLKMTMDKGEIMKKFCDIPLYLEYKKLCKDLKPKKWQHLLKEIDKKFLLIKRGYGLEIMKILRKIKLLEFWPVIDKNKIIKLNEEQREKISIVNIMRFKPYFWKGRYYSKKELCTMFGMSKDTFDLRNSKGWNLEDILMKPLKYRQTEGLEGYLGKTYGALTVLKVNKVAKLRQNTSFICRCKCGEVFSRTYITIITSKKCTCVKSTKRYRRKKSDIMKEADLVDKTVRGYLFTDKEKRTTTPGKFEWNFYGYCVECGKPIKISKYNLKNRHGGCDHWEKRKGIGINGN